MGLFFFILSVHPKAVVVHILYCRCVIVKFKSHISLAGLLLIFAAYNSDLTQFCDTLILIAMFQSRRSVPEVPCYGLDIGCGWSIFTEGLLEKATGFLPSLVDSFQHLYKLR